ncbi:T3SS effector HopA1 family protein [Nodularia harveyana UHCC-0300]|uniref:T3SS effector HopA1 family protein n=1 Tax=Nodularia harveyana UHCC-0300 TaxID=2974287 RepID=A0ABU5UFD7_9CYAN|nr:T3SS effector HopA1 family protein [Nodularia harveyana]MEA5582214.1 T3SS effector HopA1 family protein [Nodularia harveyana UHCC-0300]
MLDSAKNTLLTSLLDIASNIEIKSNFCIYHPHYQPFSLPSKVAERFQQNSADLRHKYLNLLLRNFLYGIYYNGSLQRTLAVNITTANCLRHQNLEPNSSLDVDWEFYEQLQINNHGQGYFDPSWQVLTLEPDGSMAVTKGGLTLYIEPDCHLKPSKKSPQLGESVAIWMPKNRLQKGCYLAVSNVGQEKQGHPDADLGIGRIYFNFTPDGAIACMDRLTNQLNAANIPFTFQVLHNPLGYGRYDSGILYFERQDYPALHKILQAVYTEYQAHFHAEIPLFTKFLAPGLGLAEEPTQKFAAQESFGMNRCQIVANALLEAWENGKNAMEERMNVINQHFSQHLIDLQRPYLNPSSEDIYQPLK